MISLVRLWVMVALLGTSGCSSALDRTRAPVLEVALDAAEVHAREHACVVAGPPRVVAERATVPDGITLAAREGAIEIGYRAGARERVRVGVDPSLVAVATTRSVVVEPGSRTPERAEVAIGDAVAVVLRRRGEVWISATRRDGGEVGPRVLVSSRAAASPALARAGETAIVAWQEGDSVRWARWTPGAAKVEGARALPADGDAIAIWPSLASLDDGRALLAWTEIAGDTHRVRAQLVDRDGALAGPRLTIARDARGLDVYGRASATVGGDGRGAVAFFTVDDGRFDVAATPIRCEGSGEGGVVVAR